MKKSIQLALFCLLLCNIAAAGILKGKISDANGNALAYAAVYVAGTTNGTNANMDGNYELSLEPGLYIVNCQYVGYKQEKFSVTFTGNETIEHNFTLAAQGLEMKEVVIRASGEDPAYRIIRESIKRRKFHLEQFQSFQSSIYLKGAIRLRNIPKAFEKKMKLNVNGDNNTGKGVL